MVSKEILEKLQTSESIEDTEEANGSINGVSIKFTPTVESFEEGIGLVEETINTDSVSGYSNMTGEGATQLIILVTFE